MCFPNTSKDGVSTTFLDILFQYLTTLQVNKFFLMEDGCCLPRTLKACVLGSVEAGGTALRCEMCCLHGDMRMGSEGSNIEP